jgi:multicomponent Na+:H+ antiporter subunit F
MTYFDSVIIFSLILLSFSIALILIRLIKGPSLPDRVISFDLIGTIIIGMIALYSLTTGVKAYMIVAVILSLIMFLGAVAFAYYMKNKRKQQKHDS